MKLSITDFEGGKAQIVDFGTAFVLFFQNEAVFAYDKAVFALSFADSVHAELIKNGARLYWESDPSITHSHVDITVSECGDGIAFKIEAMHDCFLDIKTDCNTIESINDGSKAFSLRIGAVTVKISGCCYFENGELKIRRGTSKLFIGDIPGCHLRKDKSVCFIYEAHKVNELIFNGKELSEYDPLFPYLLLSNGLRIGLFDESLKTRLYGITKPFSKEERERAIIALNRYLRAFGMPALKESGTTVNKHLIKTEYVCKGFYLIP